MKINILLSATIAILAFTPNYFGQLQTIDYQWGVVPGKLTRTTNIVDGQRVTNGPFSFTGNTVAMGATTLIVKGNFKNGNYNGAFNMNWSAIGAEAFTLSAVGVFSSGLLDGLWNFKIKSWEKVSYQLVKSNREVSLTFKKGQLIKGSFKDLRVNNYVIFTCDEFGDMLSFVSGSKGSGYLEEEKTDYVHGIATIESTKDVASGKYLKKPSSVTDTAILNNKNFNQQSSTFNYGNNIYKRSEAYYAFVTMFTDDLWLGQFKSDGGDAVAGYIPFIDGRYVILPVIYGSYKKLQNLTDNLDFIAAEESYLKNDLNKALVLYEKIKSDDLIPNEVSKITSKIADLKRILKEEETAKAKLEEEKKISEAKLFEEERIAKEKMIEENKILDEKKSRLIENIVVLIALISEQKDQMIFKPKVYIKIEEYKEYSTALKQNVIYYKGLVPKKNFDNVYLSYKILMNNISTNNSAITLTSIEKQKIE